MISVIIPTYNGIEVLRHSLPTWMDQTLTDEEYEVIVVDNRSTDSTRTEVKQMISGYSNFSYLYESHPGATAARHAGVRAAKGDILVFSDNDGLFNPSCLERIKEVYDRNPECDAVTGRIEILWDGSEPDWIGPYKYLLGELDYGTEVVYSYSFYLNGGLMSVRRDVFERLHGFNPDLIGKYLIGDGDTGFVKKLFREHCLIGYTPFAKMQHMQQVDRHGSKTGIALHFYNNGIAESYAVYRDSDFRVSIVVLFYLFKEVAVLLKQWVKIQLFDKNNRHLFFSFHQHLGSVRFFGYLFNPTLRRSIRVRDLYIA